MSDHATPSTSVENGPRFLGHPVGLFYLFFAELWERFSFYGMRALLKLYMIYKVFEALSNGDAVSSIVYASYGSLVYASPIVGGRIADQILGYRRSITLGGILMAIGHFVLAIENDYAFYIALAFIVVGNGFFKPNISTFVGTLYPKGDRSKDSGFTIFYMGINIGAFASPLLCGYLAEAYGYHWGFGLAGVGMMLGLLAFQYGIRKGVFLDRGLPPSDEALNKKVLGIPNKTFVPLVAVLFVPVIALILSNYHYLFSESTVVDVIFMVMTVGILGYLIYVLAQVTAEERGKLIVAILITSFMTMFWGFHELSGDTLTIFAERNVSLSFINASQTNSLNPLFIILFSIPMSWVWVKMSQKGINPRTPFKFAFGLLLLGASFLLLAFSRNFGDADGQVPMMFLVGMYLLISLGELFMSPVGLSKITDLSPARIVAFMMGVWFLSSAYAFRIVGVVGKALAVESEGGEAVVGSTETLNLYTGGFQTIAYIAIGAAAVVFLLSPLMNRWMRDVH